MKAKTLGQKIKNTSSNILHANENARKREAAEKATKIAAVAGILSTATVGVVSHFVTKRYFKKFKNEVNFDDLEERIDGLDERTSKIESFEEVGDVIDG